MIEATDTTAAAAASSSSFLSQLDSISAAGSASGSGTGTGGSSRLPNDTKKRASSKYDFVKVKVCLQDHYYILSRFIVSRMLLVTHVSAKDSIRIALELKKRLVDRGLLEVSQQELEEHMFDIMRYHGYEDDYDVASAKAAAGSGGGAGAGSSTDVSPLLAPYYPPGHTLRKKPKNCISRFKMITRFHHKRVPLLILVFGTGCVGKSMLATQLGERLNVPNVLYTDIVWDLLSSIRDRDAIGPSYPAWLRRYLDCSSTEEEAKAFLSSYESECKLIRHALEGDLEKCFKDGKAIIIEGSHLDPSYFSEMIARNENLAAGASANAAYYAKKGIIVPFYLTMNDQDHMLFLEQWLASRHDRLQLYPAANGEHASVSPQLNFEQKMYTLRSHFATMDKYIRDYIGSSIQLVEVNLHNVEKTLDEMHAHVLDRIERAYKEGVF